MRVVCAQQEKHDRHSEQEFLRRSILIAIVDLLPHVQMIVCARIEFERNSSHPMEHKIGASHVGDVGQRPGDFLSDARNDVEEDLKSKDKDRVNGPGTCALLTFV